jgi:glycosyltransferase involved in cell wall biosynthesis
MRIGLSATLMQGGGSGVGRYVLDLVGALLRHAPGHELLVFAFERDAPLFEAVIPLVQLVRISESHRHPLKDFAWHQFVLPRLAREHGLDVVHVPSHRRMVWKRSGGLVSTIYDAGAFCAPNVRTAQGSWRSALFRWLARRQHELVAITAGTAAILHDTAHVPANRITVAPPAVDHEHFSPGDHEGAAARIAARHGVRPPYFVCVARLDAANNHARLIEAFNAFKTTAPSPWQLVLIGADGRGADRIHHMVRRSPYAPDIYCAGFVTRAELPDWYRAAGALVYPAVRHGFCLPVLEAMACGCPVLMSDTGPGPELAGGAAVMADARSAAAWCAQLARLAFDPALRAQRAAAGPGQARQFDWGTTVATLLQVYARAARTPATAAVAAVPAARTNPVFDDLFRP